MLDNYEPKGRIGNHQYGYIRNQGSRNQWIVMTPAGTFYKVQQNNMNSAFKLAQRLNDDEKFASQGVR